MKRLNWTLLLLGVLLMPFLQSCDNDDDKGFSSYALTTVKTLDESGFYFLLDDNSKMFPSELNGYTGYKPKDGQRAYVYFDKLEMPKEDYEYNISVGVIDEVLTKNIIKLTEQNKDSIGDDKIRLNNAWIAGGYLNIRFQMQGSGNIQHMVNLVENETLTDDMDDADDYIDLEFRHNANNDVPYRLIRGMVCFKLGDMDPNLMDKKGINLRIKGLDNEISYFKIDLKDDEDKKM